MCLAYKKDLILKHQQPKVINVQEIPVILLETSNRARVENLFGICFTVVTLAQGVIYEGLIYDNSIVVTAFGDNLMFGKIENITFRVKSPYLVCGKLSLFISMLMKLMMIIGLATHTSSVKHFSVLLKTIVSL